MNILRDRIREMRAERQLERICGRRICVPSMILGAGAVAALAALALLCFWIGANNGY